MNSKKRKNTTKIFFKLAKNKRKISNYPTILMQKIQIISLNKDTSIYLHFHILWGPPGRPSGRTSGRSSGRSSLRSLLLLLLLLRVRSLLPPLNSRTWSVKNHYIEEQDIKPHGHRDDWRDDHWYEDVHCYCFCYCFCYCYDDVHCFCYCSVTVSYTHLRAHETRHDLVCRLLLEKKK